MTREQLKECYIDVHDNLLAASKEDRDAGFINTAFVVINVMGVEYETKATDFVDDYKNIFENLLYISLGDDCNISIDIDKICSIKLRKYGDYDEKYINSGCGKLEFSFLTKELFDVWFDRVKGLKFNKKYCLILADSGNQIEYCFGGKDGK